MQSSNYRSAVGPPDKYDIIGAQQFCVLVRHGLREQHKLLDIGCGSLRGGRLFIPYLAPGHYCGIEPNEELVNTGIDTQLGRDILSVKHPRFSYNVNFEAPFDVDFDYILAQSILSHTDQTQVRMCLATVCDTLRIGGTFLFTYFKGKANYEGAGWTRIPCAYYTQAWMERCLSNFGLSYDELPVKHPSGQTWVIAK